MHERPEGPHAGEPAAHARGRREPHERAAPGQDRRDLGGLGASSWAASPPTRSTRRCATSGSTAPRPRAVNSVSARVAEQMARGACRPLRGGRGRRHDGLRRALGQWKVAAPFAWWALARRRPRRGLCRQPAAAWTARGSPGSRSRSAWPGRPLTPLPARSGRDLLHVRHERLHLGRAASPSRCRGAPASCRTCCRG
jgi:hypothetical protein